jgi:urease accessory protein
MTFAASLPDAGLLSLVQWLSPAFPTGGYAYSHGLEWAVAQGEVTDGAGVEQCLSDILRFGAGRTDAILLAHALEPDADLDALSDLARALAPSAERLTETEHQGAAFALATGSLQGLAHVPRPLPLAVGQAAKSLGLPKILVISLYLHSFAANLVACATRFVPLGQNEGQRVLAALHPLIQKIAQDAMTASLESIATSAFRADVASMLHETLDVRIFKT